jgi:hypothetical protein
MTLLIFKQLDIMLLVLTTHIQMRKEGKASQRDLRKLSEVMYLFFIVRMVFDVYAISNSSNCIHNSCAAFYVYVSSES